MDLPSAVLGASWLLVVEAAIGGVFYLWHYYTPIRRAKREQYQQCKRR